MTKAIGMLSVSPSVVHTMAASMMDLYCSWSSHFHEDLYNSLIFSNTNIYTYHCYLMIGPLQRWTCDVSVVLNVILIWVQHMWLNKNNSLNNLFWFPLFYTLCFHQSKRKYILFGVEGFSGVCRKLIYIIESILLSYIFLVLKKKFFLPYFYFSKLRGNLDDN